MSMDITDVQVFARTDGKNTLGYANLVIAENFVVRNIRIVNGQKGVFLGMPSNKSKTGAYIDTFFPINQKARDYLTQVVLDEFSRTYPSTMEGLKVYSKEKDYVSL